MLAATMIWFASFVMLPAPTSPVSTTLPPITCSRGSQALKTPSSPPTMTARVPAMAPGSPPLTGASRNSTPLSAQAAPIFCDMEGAMLLMSMITDPGSAPSSTPSGPRIARSESAESGSMVMVRALPLAALAGDDAAVAPSVANSSTGSPMMSYTVSS